MSEIPLPTSTSSFRLEWNRRIGGDGCIEREYLNYVIDGVVLHVHLKETDSDAISRLGWTPIVDHDADIERLMLKRDPDSPSGRVVLLVCPECGDIGCGAFTARIHQEGDRFVWSAFAYENDYEEARHIPGVGPFCFDKTAYLRELKRHIGNKAQPC